MPSGLDPSRLPGALSMLEFTVPEFPTLVPISHEQVPRAASASSASPVAGPGQDGEYSVPDLAGPTLEHAMGMLDDKSLATLIEKSSSVDFDELRSRLRSVGIIPHSEGRWQQFISYVKTDLVDGIFGGSVIDLLKIATGSKFSQLRMMDEFEYQDMQQYDIAITGCEDERNCNMRMAHFSL